MEKLSPDYLKNNILALAEVPDDELQWLIEEAQQFELAEGEYLFKKDDPITRMHVIIKGRVEVYLSLNQSKKFYGAFKAGEITGMLPYSRAKIATGDGLITENAEILSLDREKINQMIQSKFALTQALVYVLTNRVRDYTQQQVQNEKLMALGKLSAGLAHELNNPASAIVRSSQALQKHLQVLPDNFKKVIKIKLNDELVDEVNNWLFEKISNPSTSHLSALERMDLEDEMIEQLEKMGLKDAYELAGNFLDFGFALNDMCILQEKVGKDFFPPILKWVHDNIVTEKIVREIQEASKRIADLINAIKNYSYMDQNLDRQEVDVHSGIQNTLKILHHKFKKYNIHIKEDFDNNVKNVKGLPGELNQLWTNLIVNAVEAMETTGGTLTIRTKRANSTVNVSIIDEGTGIPEEVKNKIFEPFFTTKAIGKGTGLGLDIVQKIVNQHNGNIKVNSEPGQTEFLICLPV
jgi:signal transduction histidine kinase